MRRLIVAALMIGAVLLTSCGGQAAMEKKLEDKREEIASAEYLSFSADVSVELSDTVFSCCLAVEKTGEGISIEVLAPEEIAGIRAGVKTGGVDIEYEEIVLAIGDDILGEVSPISAMVLALDALSKSYVNQIWLEDEFLVAESYVSDTQQMKIWYDKENLLPLHGELVQQGQVVVKYDISDFTTEPGS